MNLSVFRSHGVTAILFLSFPEWLCNNRSVVVRAGYYLLGRMNHGSTADRLTVGGSGGGVVRPVGIQGHL